MDQEELYELIDNIPVTADNVSLIGEIKEDLERKDYRSSFAKNRKFKFKKNKKEFTRKY